MLAVADVEVKRAGPIAYREALPASDPGADPVLCLHGFPESSHMWHDVLAAVADSGRRAIAPDLPGFGASPPDLPGTWERKVDAVEAFRDALGLDRVALVVHDWGGIIGLRWACDHPGVVSALVISGTGFFPDGKWHGMAQALRSEGQGEELLAALDRGGFRAMMAGLSSGFDEATTDEYYQAFESEDGRRGVLDMYRSGDFSKLEPYEGRLAALGVPTLLLWGAGDEFARVASAHRFQREIPGAELVVLDGAGHFLFADEPERTAREVVAFLSRSG